MLWKSCRLSALLPRVLDLLLELGAGRHPAEQCAAWSVWLTFGASVRSPEALDCVPQFPQVSNEGRDSICLPGEEAASINPQQGVAGQLQRSLHCCRGCGQYALRCGQPAQRVQPQAHV